jgi:hypothetical protein
MGVKLVASSGGSVELVPTNTASNFTVTVPAATTTMVGTDATQTLTNKTSTTFGVGNATPSASGAGITFPATQSASTDANTLDDYEEGTFTATIAGMGSATNNNVTARYIKIGRVVTLYFPYANYTTNAGSGASDVTVALPFPITSAFSMSAALGMQSGGSATASKHTNLYFSSGNSTSLFYYDDLTAWTRVTGSLLVSTWYWSGNVVYLTDS